MTDLYYRTGTTPVPLPPIAFDTDNNAYTDPYEPGVVEMLGFILAPSKPDDTETQTVEWDITAETWVMVDRPPSPPEPAPQPAVLGKLQFILLAQSAGGMTDAMLVDAQKNAAFAAFWIKFQMAQAVERDSPITSASLDALAQGGYLPKGKAAVLAAWPLG